MIVTEDEAKTKCCCQGQMCGSARWNTEIGGFEFWCIASACMAWRSAETADFRATAEAEFRRSGRRIATNTGYCGLAGGVS